MPRRARRCSSALLAEAYERGSAIEMAAALEIDAVIDPAETRTWIRARSQARGGRGRGSG